MTKGSSTQFDLSKFKQNDDGSFSKISTTPQPRAIKPIPVEYKFDDGTRITLNSYPPFSGSPKLEFKWADKHISLNEWYSSKHWTNRNKKAKEWHEFFKSYLLKPYPRFEKYSITLEFNSRLDPSNTITMIKLVEDMMQKEGVIINDNKDCCVGVHIIPVLDMKKFSYKITVNAV